LFFIKQRTAFSRFDVGMDVADDDELEAVLDDLNFTVTVGAESIF